jgi:hypothetical protein
MKGFGLMARLFLPVETETAATGTPASPPAAAADPVALQRQVDELKEQIGEANRTSEFWAGKARAGGAAPQAAAAAEDDTDVLEAITTGGAKGFDALAEKRGFIKREGVEKLIDERAQSLTTEQNLLQEFPDLKNKQTDFFKATASHYGELIKGGTPQHVAMGLAAKQAQLQFIIDGKIKVGAAAAPTKEEKEAARLARVAAQGGEGRRGPAAGAGDEDDNELDAQQLNIVRKMLVGTKGKDGKPMDEEQAIAAYKVRARGGVQMRAGR